MEVWEGSVSGTVAYACLKRRPRAAIALKAGVLTSRASGPIASARVVSMVMSKIDGRAADPGVPDEPADRGARSSVRPHASSAAVSPTAHTRQNGNICRFYKRHDDATVTSQAGGGWEWTTI